MIPTMRSRSESEANSIAIRPLDLPRLPWSRVSSRSESRSLRSARPGAVGFRARRPTAPGLADLNERLSDRLDTRVKVTLGKSKGRIAIEFASLADLERIVGIIDPRKADDRPI
jgi:hypothetical protein